MEKIENNYIEEYTQMHYPFVNLALPYAYDALQPNIDAKTMQLHHSRHLQKYVDGLNAALSDYPTLHNRPLRWLLSNISALPAKIQLDVRRQGGGTYNHFMYFGQLSGERVELSAEVREMIITKFGGLENFHEELKDAALSVFGSGYAWVANTRNGPIITTTPNQDNPFMFGQVPILVIDVWEHAYYLKHYNDCSAYIDDLLDSINLNVLVQS